MILTGPAIRSAIESGDIYCGPAPAKIGPNSMDLNLGKVLYEYGGHPHLPLSTRSPPPSCFTHELDEQRGTLLLPGKLYLGATVQYIGSDKYVPYIGGRSSVGRLGIRVHATAGFGDLGFFGNWTLEIDVIRPVLVYPNDVLAQMWFFVPQGEIELYQGRYQHSEGIVPTRMYERK